MTSSFEVKLSSFLCWKGRSSKQYMKDTWVSASAKAEPDTMCTGLESTQTSNISWNHAQHANVTAHRNHNSHPRQHQPQNTQGNSSALTTFTFMDLNSWLSQTTTPRCPCQKNPCISMQCLQDYLSSEGTLHRTWHPRGTPY